jgi:uncharacterized membrane protein YdjX (TVP38/TMEM64 family)
LSASPKQRLIRIGILAGVTIAIFVALKLSGALDDFDARRVRGHVEAAGIWGALLYVVMFSAGELIHIPGMVFVAAGIMAYGRTVGFGLALAGSLCSVVVSFVLVRAIGGKALAEIERPWMKRIMAKLDQRPILTVVVLRSVLWLAPALNYALALSSIRFRDYLIGSAIGLLVPILAASFVFDWLIIS